MTEGESDIKIESTIVGGTEIGVQARSGGKTLGTYYTQFHPRESSESGRAVIRGRVEVDENSRGKGIGSKLV